MCKENLIILSIEAWCELDGWFWNNWLKIGELTQSEFDLFDDNFKAFEFVLDAKIDKRKYTIVDDGYNLILCKRKHPFADSLPNCPLYAIQYGHLY